MKNLNLKLSHLMNSTLFWPNSGPKYEKAMAITMDATVFSTFAL